MQFANIHKKYVLVCFNASFISQLFSLSLNLLNNIPNLKDFAKSTASEHAYDHIHNIFSWNFQENTWNENCTTNMYRTTTKHCNKFSFHHLTSIQNTATIWGLSNELSPTPYQ